MKKINKIFFSIWPILILLFFTIFYFHRLFWPKFSLFYTPDFGRTDVFDFNFALKDYLRQSLTKGQLPLWSKNLGGGFPLFAEGQIGPLNLANLALFFFLPTWLAYNLGFVVIFFTFASGTYFYAKQLKMGTLGAIFASLSFSFSTFLTEKITHYNHLQAASYLLWIMLCLEKYLSKRKKTYLVIIAVLFSQQIFAGYPLMVFLTSLAFILRIFFHLLSSNFKDLKSLLFPLVLVLYLSLGLSAIQILPTLEYFSWIRLRGGLPFEVIFKYPYHLKNLLNFLSPFFLGEPQKGTYNYQEYGIYWENSAFIGLPALALAFLGIFWANKKYKKVFLSLLFFSFLMAWGKGSPLQFLFGFPPFNLFRVSSRYLLLTIFSLTIFAGFALEKILKVVARFGKLPGLVIALVAIALNFYQLYEFGQKYHLLVPKDELLSLPETASFLKNQKAQKIFPHQIYGIWNYFFFHKGWQDPLPFLYLKNILGPNTNLIWNLGSSSVYTTFLPARASFLPSWLDSEIELINGRTSIEASFSAVAKKILRIQGVSHLISNHKITNEDREFLLLKIFEPKDKDLPPFYIYKVNQYLPLFYFVSDYQHSKTLEDIFRTLKKDDFNPGKTVILEKEINPDFAQDLSKDIKIKKYEDQEVWLEVETPKKLLVINQSFYPGWQALIDGEKTEILAANLAQIALIVPQGKHEIQLKFSPISFKIGLAITLATSLIVLLLLLESPSQRR